MTRVTAGSGHGHQPDSYLTEHGRLGSEPIVTVSSPDGAARVVLALRGATLLRWEVNRLGAPFDLTDGYRDEAELLAQDGVRNGVLAPFPNRVADARYTFAGIEHDLLPGREPGRTAPRLSYHGFARELPFDLAEAVVSADCARLTFATRFQSGRHSGYPFRLQFAVTYIVTANEITVTTRATNQSASVVPYAAGWHPYFRLPGAVDDWTLEIPARTVIRTDDALIPLDGAAAYQSLDDVPALDFRLPRKLSGLVIDACFTDLRPNAGHRAETVLRHTQSSDELHVWQSAGSMHVFTGDTLARDRRHSIALEPVEVITNAFNRSDFARVLRLNPGQSRTFHFGVRYVCGR